MEEDPEFRDVDAWFDLGGSTAPAQAIAVVLHGMYIGTDLTDPEARLALLDADRAAGDRNFGAGRRRRCLQRKRSNHCG